MAATIALVCVIGGGAVAVGGVTDGQTTTGADRIQACFVKKGANKGELRLLVKGKCTGQEKKITWNAVGPEGPPGPATGPAGGDLAGSYPDPQVANGAVGEQELGCSGNDPLDVMVRAGTVCIDKFEASLWTQPNGGTQLTTEVQIDAVCSNNGQDCEGDIFARSVAGVQPARDVTWFQAVAALANSGKRLPSNGEWTMAAAGTPGNPPAPGSEDCNTASAGTEVAGQRANCESQFGAFDMVGNLWEWVADWDEQADAGACANLNVGTGFEGDRTCSGDSSPIGLRGALLRGGDFDDGDSAGVMANDSRVAPFHSTGTGPVIGFRGAR